MSNLDRVKKAFRQAEATIENEYGYWFDFKTMDYRDAHNKIIPSKRIAQIKREIAQDLLGPDIDIKTFV